MVVRITIYCSGQRASFGLDSTVAIEPRAGDERIILGIDFMLLTGIMESYMYGILSLSPALGFC